MLSSSSRAGSSSYLQTVSPTQRLPLPLPASLPHLPSLPCSLSCHGVLLPYLSVTIPLISLLPMVHNTHLPSVPASLPSPPGPAPISLCLPLDSSPPSQTTSLLQCSSSLGSAWLLVQLEVTITRASLPHLPEECRPQKERALALPALTGEGGGLDLLPGGKLW